MHAKEFLEAGHRVQFTMIYKGREIAHQNLGEQIMNGVVTQLADFAKVERRPFREGKRVGLILAPKQAVGEKSEKPEKPKASSGGGSAQVSTPPTPPAAPAAVAVQAKA
jgi:translation initiation factor IF-3